VAGPNSYKHRLDWIPYIHLKTLFVVVLCLSDKFVHTKIQLRRVWQKTSINRVD